MKGLGIGHGFDVHRFAAGRALRLGGIEVPHDRGLVGHSDGDVLLHAVASALLGAAGQGDLGAHFPSDDEALRGIDSARILARVVALLADAGRRVLHVDATLIAQQPRLAPHLAAMRRRVAGLLGVPESAVNIKVTSTDGLGAIGRGEGIGAAAVALVAAQPEISGAGPGGEA